MSAEVFAFSFQKQHQATCFFQGNEDPDFNGEINILMSSTLSEVGDPQSSKNCTTSSH